MTDPAADSLTLKKNIDGLTHLSASKNLRHISRRFCGGFSTPKSDALYDLLRHIGSACSETR